MRWRLIALVLFGVNIALAAAWLLSSRQQNVRLAAALAASERPPVVQTTTNIVPRRQPFSWRDIESPDYATYAANLRDIGCPEQTIRDIIIADVNALYARKRALELVTAEQQWWRSEPDTNVVRAAVLKAQELEEERRTLLASLLGPNWEAADQVSLPRPSRPGVVLDGPVLGALSAETKKAIQEVNARSQDRLQTYLAAQSAAGKEPDVTEMAKLRQQTRNDLARLLSPPELEEYLLRYSQTANDMRAEFAQLRYFNTSSNEFRAMFRATDSLDQRIALLADATDPGSVAARKALENQRESAIKLALGAKRYDEFRLLHDPLYQDDLEKSEGDPELARAQYAIDLAALRAAGTNRLSPEQLETLDAFKTANLLPPEPAPTPPPPPPKKVYVLGAGDSVNTIALMYGLPVEALKAANPKVDFNKPLKPGISITIPPSPFAAPTPP